jgi:hypothetical protein
MYKIIFSVKHKSKIIVNELEILQILLEGSQEKPQPIENLDLSLISI